MTGVSSSQCRDLLHFLYDRCMPSVVRRALRVLGSREEAMDVAHDTFVALLGRCSTVVDHPRPAALVYAAATNGCFNRLKSWKLRRSEALEEALEPSELTSGPVEARQVLWKIAQVVDAETFQIGLACWLEGMSQEEAAEVFDLSRKTVGKKLKEFQELAASLVKRGPDA